AFDPRRTPISPRLQSRTRTPRGPREGPSPGNRSGTHSSSPVRDPGLPGTKSWPDPPPIRPVPLRCPLEENAAPTGLAPTRCRIGERTTPRPGRSGRGGHVLRRMDGRRALRPRGGPRGGPCGRRSLESCGGDRAHPGGPSGRGRSPPRPNRRLCLRSPCEGRRECDGSVARSTAPPADVPDDSPDERDPHLPSPSEGREPPCRGAHDEARRASRLRPALERPHVGRDHRHRLSGDPNWVTPDASDVAYLLEVTNDAFPDAHVGP